MKRIILLVVSQLLIVVLQAQVFQRTPLGISTRPSNSLGCSWGDLNNDTFQDLIIVNFNDRNNEIYLNVNGNYFSSYNDHPLCNVSGPYIMGTITDFTCNGLMDILLLSENSTPHYLAYQYAYGSWNTLTSSEFDFMQQSYCCSWSDIDHDGDIDLFIGDLGPGFNQLFINNGTGTFTRDLSCGLSNTSYTTHGSTWIDLNSDGLEDLYIQNMYEPPAVFMNNADGTYEYTEEHTIYELCPGGNSATWADFDNDLDLDVFITAAGDADNYLLINNDNQFALSNDFDIVAGQNFSRTACWGDFDNNGWLDLIIGNLYENYLYLNQGDGTFDMEDFTSSVNVANLPTISMAVADFNNDGCLDFFESSGAGYAGMAEMNNLYSNLGNSNNWVQIPLQEIPGEYTSIGAIIKVLADTDDDGSSEWQMRKVLVQSSRNSQDTIVSHFGLGQATVIDSIVIEWVDGTVTTDSGLPVNSFHRFNQSGRVYKTVSLSEENVQVGQTAEMDIDFCDMNCYIDNFDVSVQYEENILTNLGISEVNTELTDNNWSFDVSNINGIVTIEASGDPVYITSNTIFSFIFRLDVECTYTDCVIIEGTYNEIYSFDDTSDGAILSYSDLIGDVNLDYSLDESDCQYILDACSGSRELTNVQLQNADVDTDEYVTAYDSATLSAYINETIPSLPNSECFDISNESIEYLHLNREVNENTEIFSVPVIYTASNSIYSLDLILSYNDELFDFQRFDLFDIPDNWQYSFSSQNSLIYLTAAGINPLPETGILSQVVMQVRSETFFDSTYIAIESLSINRTNLDYYPIIATIVNQSVLSENVELINTCLTHFPNPFNLSLDNELTFILPVKENNSQASLEVFNLRGQLVKRVNTDYLAGKNSYKWDGLSDRNEKVASGIYFYKYKDGKNSLIKKLLIIR